MKKKYLIIAIVALIFGFVIYNFSNSMAMIENDSQVEPNSKLTYYIDVIYDGKDLEAVTSSDTATAKVYSDYIYVEDKIPEGLTFNKFITAEDGTIGAIKRSDGSSCSGYVVDDEDGLHYDTNTNMVSFKVNGLQAGCKLTVGIETTTPSLEGYTRRDFYNTASARENDFSVFSNTLHVFMGRDSATLNTVTYQYTGTIPSGAPTLPNSNSYSEGVPVGVENNVTIAGYTFSGWTTEDVTVNNGNFTMPNGNVVFTGSFTPKTTYNVSYSINGTKPKGYETPTTKNYGVGDDVIVDTLEEGDIINGYRFLGWTNTNIDLTDGIFTMPSNNVNLTGTFEKVTYTITYKFQGTDIPTNAESLIPETRSYAPGEIINLANNPTASGYEFLGWYHEDKFPMPEENITIYGEWKKKNGVFTPTIKKEIDNKKEAYKKGETISFKITITNTANYPIKEVLVQENLKDIKFKEGEGYTVKGDRYVVIPTITANSSITLTATYKVEKETKETITNTVEITGALADNNYELDTTKEYKSSVEFLINSDRKTETKEETKTETKTTTNTTKTLDDIYKYLAIFIISLIAIIILVIYNKKKK